MSPTQEPAPQPAQEPTEGRVPVVGCVLVAGGSGTRLGLGVPKALASAGPATLLELAVAAVAAASSGGGRTVDTLVVVVPAAELDACTALVRRAWRDARGGPEAVGTEDRDADGAVGPVVPGGPVVVPGGEDRQASVAAGLAALATDVDVVLVHDAARALTPPSVFSAVAGAVRGDVVAVVPGLTPADTVKRLAPPPAAPDGPTGAARGPGGHPAGGLRQVAETLDRASLVAVQTPQGFRADVLRALHRDAAPDLSSRATDDAGLAEAAGHPVLVVPGHPEAFKVTTALDLVLARALLRERAGGQDGPRER